MADTTVVERIEKYIDEKDYKSALSEIKTLSDKDLSDGRAYYQMARLMLDTGNEEDAYDYLRQALNAGYKTAGSCFLMAQSAERHEGFEAVDDSYLQAISLTEDVEEIRGISMFRALYHLRSNKSLSAEKIAKRLIEQFPDSYDGYHLCFLSAMKREKYEEAGSYLDLVSDGFSDNSQYLFDRIELMKAEKDMSEVVAELEADKRYMKTIPIYSLRQKLTYYYDQQDSQKYFETASYLGAKYNDKDAYGKTLDEVRLKHSLNWAMLMITDVIKETSVLLTTDFKLNKNLQYKKLENNIYDMPGVLSRKKQLMPDILSLINQ